MSHPKSMLYDWAALSCVFDEGSVVCQSSNAVDLLVTSQAGADAAEALRECEQRWGAIHGGFLMAVLPNHPLLWGLSITNHQFVVVPPLWKPLYENGNLWLLGIFHEINHPSIWGFTIYGNLQISRSFVSDSKHRVFPISLGSKTQFHAHSGSHGMSCTLW